MTAVVDTSVWIAAWRRAAAGTAVRRIVEQTEDLVGVPGIVLQEVLAGARDAAGRGHLLRLMMPYQLLLATERHHVEAAALAGACRRAGFTVHLADALIAATTLIERAELLTLDRDFLDIARCAPLNVRILAT